MYTYVLHLYINEYSSRFVIPWSATYVAVYLQSNLGYLSYITILNIYLGTPDRAPGVMINEDSVRINGSNVTLTLSWGEPFSYFGPIISYTVSWNDSTFPSSFTITDNTTRNYTITNLTPMTNYTFSVVATNSFGSGEAGILIDTTPGEGVDKELL